MEKTTLHQVLSDREEKRREDAAEHESRREAAAVRYFELIKSGSVAKKDVEELLAVAETIGKSPSDMREDLANIEGAQRSIQKLNSYAGSETALVEIASLMPALSEATHSQIKRLQRQLRTLADVIESARGRVEAYKGDAASFARFKSNYSELLEGIDAPCSSIIFDGVSAADSVPEFAAWLKDYVELQPAKLSDAQVVKQSAAAA